MVINEVNDGSSLNLLGLIKLLRCEGLKLLLFLQWGVAVLLSLSVNQSIVFYVK